MVLVVCVCRNFINIPDYLLTRIHLEIAAFRFKLTNVTMKLNYNITLQSNFNCKAGYE